MKRATRSKARQYLARVSKNLRSELRTISYDTGREMKNWLEVVTRDWTHKPRFVPTVIIRPDYIEVKLNVAGTAKDIFKYVDQGTGLYGPKKRAYVIAPKNPDGFLKFQRFYSAKTAPIAKVGQGTGEHSGDWIQKKEVLHPGIPGRHFTDKVIEELDPPWRDRIDEAFSNAMKG